VIGLPGAGKTQFIHNEIREICIQDPTGPPVFLLVPEQISHETERAVLGSGLEASVRMRVLSFRRLYQWCFSQMEKSKRMPLNDVHRRALVASILSKMRRQVENISEAESDNPRPNTLIKTANIERTIDGMIRELLEYRLDADQIRDWATEAESFSRILAGKLHELADVASQFRELIEQRFETPEDTGNRVGEFLEKENSLLGTEIFLDHFYGFDRAQQKIMTHFIQRAKRTTLLLTISPSRFEKLWDGAEPDTLSSFYPVEETLYWIFQWLKTCPEPPKIEVTTLPDVEANDFDLVRFQKPELQQLVHRFTVFGKTKVDNSIQSEQMGTEQTNKNAIRFVEHSSPEKEAENAITQILQWKKKHGWNRNEMAILCRSFEGYLYTLKNSCHRSKIPVFIDHLEPLATHPLIRGLESIIEICFRKFSQESVLTLAKSGFVNLEQYDVSLLEAVVTQLPKSTSQWFQKEPWRDAPSKDLFSDEDEPKELMGNFHQTRKVLTKPLRVMIRELEKIKKENEYPVHEVIQILCEVVRDYYSGDGVFVEDVLKQFGQCCQAIIESSAEDLLPASVMADLLEDALHQVMLPQIPPTVDQLIIGQADRSRLPTVKGVVVLGLNDGVFPKSNFENSLLNDNEREFIQSLNQKQEHIKPSKRLQLARERYHALYAFSRASKELVLSRSSVNSNGQLIPPSPYWKELRKFFPYIKVEDADHVNEKDFTPAYFEQGLSQVSETIWKTDEIFYELAPESTRVLENLEEKYHADYRRFRNFQARRNSASLNPNTFSKSIGKIWRTSASAMNAFGKCPYKNFMQKFLRPYRLEQFKASAIEYGNYAHAILHEMMKDIIMNESILHDKVLYDSCFEEKRALVHHRFEEKGYLAQNSVAEILNQFDTMLRSSADALFELLNEMELSPIGTETSFGKDENILGPDFNIRKSDGDSTKVTFRGQVDLLLQRTAEPSLLLAFDFKLSKKSLRWQEVSIGSDTQFPVYYLVLKEFASTDLTIQENAENLGALHFNIIQKESDGPRSLNGIVSSYWNDISTKENSVRNVFDSDNGSDLPEKFSKIIERQLTQVLSGNCEINPLRIGKNTACSYCDFKKACRVDYTQNRVRNFPPERNDQAFKNFFASQES